jgi:hypothetical protein
MMSFDPVAHDTIGFDMLCRLLREDGGDPARYESQAAPWLANGAEIGLGTNDLSNIDLEETVLS